MRIRARRSPEGSCRALAILLSALLMAACGSGDFFRQYEYEEDLYLSLDGSATIYVNASIAALDALRGTSFDASQAARFDREPFRRYFESPVTHVTRVSQSRRSGRRFVHVRLDVGDVRRLAEAPPFAWSTYSFERVGNLLVYKQRLGGSAGKSVGNVGWTGRESVAVRLHIPSKVEYHNTLVENFKRGNILVWEQSLADRLRGVPLEIDARMQTQSILYRTLWLFGLTFVAVAIGFAITIWWIMRRGKATDHVQSMGGA
jgi:hypothetical protein